MMANIRDVVISQTARVKLLKLAVNKGQQVKLGSVLATFSYCDKKDDTDAFISQHKLKAKFSGTVVDLVGKANDEIKPGQSILKVEENHCSHSTIMKEMCCDCGADLRKEPGIPGDLVEPVAASVPMVHNIPELRVSVEEAEKLAKKDERQLLKARKLALVVDLDQTLIHTTVEQVPLDIKDLFHFRLPGHPYEYHTKLRPGAKRFLEAIAQYYELHIFTMGSRMYAHTIARFLDPEEKLFAHRIRSRDECFNAFSKSQDLRALFPCGDHMVCIIDDREDIWSYVPNLVSVKPYRYFADVGDINAPPQPPNGDAFGIVSEGTSEHAENAVVTHKKCSEQDQDRNLESRPSQNKAESDNLLSDLKGTKRNEEIKNTSEKSDSVSNSEDKTFEHCKEEKEEKNEKEERTKDGSTKKESTPKDLENERMPQAEVKEDSKKEEQSCTDIDSASLTDSSDMDDYLFYLEDILERIHVAFYSSLDAIKGKGGTAKSDPLITRYCTSGTINPDIRVIVPELKRQTLEGTSLVFTGVVPINMQLEKSRAWRVATSLGARVTLDIIKPTLENAVEKVLGTTHVIAARAGTEKARRALKMKDIKLVNPNWLWCCHERWEWLDERLFPVSYSDKNNSDSTPSSSRQGTPTRKTLSKVAEAQLSGNNKNGGETDEPSRTGLSALTRSSFSALQTFSTNEIEEMDREVQELMQTEDEEGSDDDREEAVDSSTPEGSHDSSAYFKAMELDDLKDESRQYPDGKSEQGSEEGSSSERDSSLHASVGSCSSSDEEMDVNVQRKQTPLDELKQTLKDRKRKLDCNSEDEYHTLDDKRVVQGASSSSENSSSESESELEEEGQMALMLERQISGSPYPE